MDYQAGYTSSPVSQAITQAGTDVQNFSAYHVALKTDEQRARAHAIAESFDPHQSVLAIPNFASLIQSSVAEGTKPVLEAVKIRDIGPAQQVLIDFAKQLNGVNLNPDEKKIGWVRKLFSYVFRELDPWFAFFRSLQSVQRLFDKMEVDLGKTSDKMVERITWFDAISKNIEKKIPELYVHAAALELVRDREIERLNGMEKQLLENTDPQFGFEIQKQRETVIRLRAKVYDLNEGAMTAFLMVPVLRESLNAAMTINDGVITGIRQTLPKMRLALATIIGQQDARQAAQAVIAIDQANMRIQQQLAESLGQTNQSVRQVMDSRLQSVQSLRALRDSVVVQMNEAVKLNDELAHRYQEAMNAFGEISDSVRTAAAKTTSV
jgi:uncharacterized protein YaaN involved in tellurite resistance